MASGDTLVAIIAIEIAMLNTFPALLSIVLTPEAIPLLFAGTALKIDVEFGEKNNPDPVPIRDIQIINSIVDVLSVIHTIPNNPTAEISSPKELKILESYLSDKIPLIGEMRNIDIARGVNNIPAVTGSSPLMP